MLVALVGKVENSQAGIMSNVQRDYGHYGYVRRDNKCDQAACAIDSAETIVGDVANVHGTKCEKTVL